MSNFFRFNNNIAINMYIYRHYIESSEIFVDVKDKVLNLTSFQRSFIEYKNEYHIKFAFPLRKIGFIEDDKFYFKPENDYILAIFEDLFDDKKEYTNFIVKFEDEINIKIAEFIPIVYESIKLSDDEFFEKILSLVEEKKACIPV